MCATACGGSDEETGASGGGSATGGTAGSAGSAGTAGSGGAAGNSGAGGTASGGAGGLATGGGGGGAGSNWDVLLSPPPLNSPTKYTQLSQIPIVKKGSFGVIGAGEVYEIKAGKTEDVLVDFRGQAHELDKPLWFIGGRNIIVLGLNAKMKVQPGNGAYQLPNNPTGVYSLGATVSGSPAPNSAARPGPGWNHEPRLPGSGMLIRFQHYGAAWLEGALLNMNGHQGDCVVTHAPSDMTLKERVEQRRVTIQNSHFREWEGQGDSPEFGDGVHGDVFQQQGGTYHGLWVENLSVYSGQEGITVLGDPKFSGDDTFSRKLWIRNYQYSHFTKWDLGKPGQGRGGPVGFKISSSAVKTSDPLTKLDRFYYFENIWYVTAFAGARRTRPTPLVDYVDPTGPTKPNGSTKVGDAEFHHFSPADGPPPSGDIVPQAAVGHGYVSPHGHKY